MSALAFAPRRAVHPASAPSGPRSAGRLPLQQSWLVRFNASGEIQWMNDAARDTLGPLHTVMDALTSGRPMPAWRSFRLGEQWLWIGLAAGSEARFGEKLRRIRRLLEEACQHRASRNIELASAHGVLRLYAHRGASGRLLRKAGADFIATLEAERGRIARELHDNAGQSLAGILLNLELVERHLGAANTEAIARLGRSKEVASLALDQIRRISHDLNPPEWSGVEFSSAVEWLVDSMGAREKLLVEMEAIDIPADLSPAIKTTLYRTLQEGLTNVLRHSGAGRVVIQASVSPAGARLVIQDDGKGFDPAETGGGNRIGLTNIRRRVEALGGKLEISTAPGGGVRLSVLLPVNEA